MESTHLLVFLFAHLKTFLAVGAVAVAASSGVALMLDEYYESTVVMFATSQHSIGEQFFEETKKNDLLAYGETEDAERLLQILNSHRIRNRIIDKYDLFTHYDIDRTAPGSKADMAKAYNSNVSASLTRFGSIQVRVLDTDPEVARDMANDMAYLVDSVANKMRNERARDAFNLAQSTLRETSQQIAEAEDSLATLHRLGIYDFEAQVEGLTAQYGMAVASNNDRAAATIRQDLERIGALANGYNNLSAYLEAAYEQQALLKKRVELMRVDAETQLPSSFVVDYASAADKKAKPVRWLIVAMTTMVSLVAAFLAMLAFDSLKRAQSSAPNA
jgi:capsule polysaccharide export protein KpsE/RkpR